MENIVPPHEVVLLACVFVPQRDVHKPSLLVIQVEVKLLSPLRVQGFGNCLSQAAEGNRHCVSITTCVTQYTDYKANNMEGSDLVNQNSLTDL